MDELQTTPNQVTKPVNDLSPRVVRLAQLIDRLPPGNYEISLQKQEIHAQDWSVEIVRTEKIFADNPPKYNPE